MSNAPVVVLIHGIRTAAWWQNRIASMIESETQATVIPIKYGYFDLLRFWCPFGPCRSGPVEKLRQQIEGIAKNYGDRPLIVFAHSYGTYALARVILQNPYFRFDRIILCGSVVPANFDWRAVEDQIRGDEKRNAIINECGTRDIWPVMAQSVTWGYGATGTYGFGTFNVRDRFHNITHSDFFADEFARKYWIPLVKGEKVSFSEEDARGGGTPAWFNLLRLPLKWLPLAAVVLAAFLVIRPLTAVAQCKAGLEQVVNLCVDTANLVSSGELDERVQKLLEQIQHTLDLKESSLFPSMSDYAAAPSVEKWQAVKTDAVELLGSIDAGLKQIVDYNGKLISTDDGVFYLVKGVKIPVEPGHYHAFNEVRKHFDGRSSIVAEMQSAGDLPDVSKVIEWKKRLETLHDQLHQSLTGLSRLLKTV